MTNVSGPKGKRVDGGPRQKRRGFAVDPRLVARAIKGRKRISALSGGHVENPFGFWADGPVSATHRAGVHFVGFGPSGQHFETMRREMDSQDLKAKHNLPDENIGFTDMLVTSHRQNYLLPPRAHRAFPLAELL